MSTRFGSISKLGLGKLPTMGGPDSDRAERAPVDLRAFAAGELQREEGGIADPTDQADELLEDGVTLARSCWKSCWAV